MKALYSILILLLLLSLISCEQNLSSGDNTLETSDFNADPNRVGKGGSMARFTISGDRLYTVDMNKLRIFDISEERDPVYLSEHTVGDNVETIFPYKDNLFIGTSWGMYIYSISNPDQPRELSFYQHIFGCDPVVANDKYAFVSIRTGLNACQFGVSRLDVLDISDLREPTNIKTIFVNSPRGLGLQFNDLYLCDNGIWKYDISDILTMEESAVKIGAMDAYDVIPFGDYLGVIGEDGLYQYRNENGTLVEVSRIEIQR